MDFRSSGPSATGGACHPATASCSSPPRFSLAGGRLIRLTEPVRADALSKRRDIVESRDGDNLVTPNQHTSPIPADAQANGIMDVDFSCCRAVAKVVQIRVAKLDKLGITANKVAQADVARDQVDNHGLSQHRFQKR
jgi:hypothetical protein